MFFHGYRKIMCSLWVIKIVLPVIPFFSSFFPPSFLPLLSLPAPCLLSLTPSSPCMLSLSLSILPFFHPFIYFSLLLSISLSLFLSYTVYSERKSLSGVLHNSGLRDLCHSCRPEHGNCRCPAKNTKVFLYYLACAHIPHSKHCA